MNRKNHIAARIEKNRIALLRTVFCWLLAASCLKMHGDRPLPRRVAAWAADLLLTIEKATGYLLIAIFYRSQIKRKFNPAFEKETMRLIVANQRITLGALTMAGIIRRLKALQNTLHNLLGTARRIAKSVAAHARITLLKIAAFAQNSKPMIAPSAPIILPERAIPP